MRLGKKTERCEIVYHMSADASIDGIAVHEVADVMYAFAEAVDEAMKLSGEQGQLKVNVRPFRQGSFITEFVVTYAHQGITLFSSQEANALSNVLGMLGFMGVGISIPVIVRKVRGRIDKCTRNEDGSYSYGDTDPVTVSETEHKVIQSPKVAKALKTVYVGPMINIDNSINVTVQSKQEFEAKSTAGTTANQLDICAMDGYERIAVEGIPEEHDDEVHEICSVSVTPLAGPYTGSERGYRFKCLGDTWDHVQIRDLEFLKDLESGKIRFMNKDVLVVDLEIVQSITKSGKESVRRTITKVHEYRPYEPPKQMTIEDAEADMGSNVLP